MLQTHLVPVFTSFLCRKDKKKIVKFWFLRTSGKFPQNFPNFFPAVNWFPRTRSLKDLQAKSPRTFNTLSFTIYSHCTIVTSEVIKAMLIHILKPGNVFINTLTYEIENVPLSKCLVIGSCYCSTLTEKTELFSKDKSNGIIIYRCILITISMHFQIAHALCHETLIVR